MTGYVLHQCALYKVQSKKRLAGILHTPVPVLLALAEGSRYKQFELAETICEFTGVKKDARNVEEPKRTLRRIHDRVRDLLSRVELVSYAHAAVKGRSYRSNAEAHKDSDVLATFDIKKFYPSTTTAHVSRFFFAELKCAPDVADLLARLLCFRSEPEALGCLPTGSPSSPILSVYANKPMFDRLDGLARELDLRFTCYVDDLTFSGAALPSSLLRRVKGVVEAHGHSLHPTKTRFFGPGKAKHVTGVVLRDGEMTVPNRRLYKARRIQEVLALAADPAERARLTRKLSGLLGEAAALDKTFERRARAVYRALAMEMAKPVVTVGGAILTLDAVSPVNVLDLAEANTSPDAPWTQ